MRQESLCVEEDKVKISWMPADIERWLHSRGQKSQMAIGIDSYEVINYWKNLPILGCAFLKMIIIFPGNYISSRDNEK